MRDLLEGRMGNTEKVSCVRKRKMDYNKGSV